MSYVYILVECETCGGQFIERVAADTPADEGDVLAFDCPKCEEGEAECRVVLLDDRLREV